MSLNPVLQNEDLKKISVKSKKKTDKEFTSWLKRRKSGVSGIENFLKHRSQNIDNLIFSTWEVSKLSDKKDLSLFAVGGYGRK